MLCSCINICYVRTGRQYIMNLWLFRARTFAVRNKFNTVRYKHFFHGLTYILQVAKTISVVSVSFFHLKSSKNDIGLSQTFFAVFNVRSTHLFLISIRKHCYSVYETETSDVL